MSAHRPHEADEHAVGDTGEGNAALVADHLGAGLGVDAAVDVAIRCRAAAQERQERVDEAVEAGLEGPRDGRPTSESDRCCVRVGPRDCRHTDTT